MEKLLLPRGVRNNNPGNIRLSKIRWQGQRHLQTDAEFAEFDDAVMGLRALMRLLLTYHVKHNLDTVESIINRYAPPVENATDRYIHHVAKCLGVQRRESIDLKNATTLVKLTAAIVLHENGRPPKDSGGNWYAPDLFVDAARLALQNI